MLIVFFLFLDEKNPRNNQDVPQKSGDATAFNSHQYLRKAPLFLRYRQRRIDKIRFSYIFVEAKVTVIKEFTKRKTIIKMKIV
jgi:hypothetical protein